MPLRALVTAPPGTGKTTLCTKVTEELSRLGCDVHGFLCHERRDAKGRRVGFDLSTLDNSGRAPLASVEGPSTGYMVGKYHVQVEAMEAFALPLLDSALERRNAGPRVFVFDEIGKMELYSSQFVTRVRELLRSPEQDLHVLGTVALNGGGFIAESKRMRGLEVVEIDAESRDAKARQLSARYADAAARTDFTPGARQVHKMQEESPGCDRGATVRRRWQVKTMTAEKVLERDKTSTASFAVFGKAVYGQLGESRASEGSGDIRKVAVAAKAISDASLGFDHSAVVADGKLLLFGKNHRGQCAQRCTGERDEKCSGDPNEDVYVPTLAQGLPEAIQIRSVSCGGAHTLALLMNGQVWSCGDHANGQCGLGTGCPKIVSSFRRLDSLRAAESIASGFKHSAAICSGQLYVWGGCGQGQLGLGGRKDVQLPTQLEIGASIRQVSLGRWHSLVLTKTNQAWSFGWGRFGVLGQGDVTDHRSPVQVAGLSDRGEVHCLAAGAVHNGAIVGAARQLFVWGRGSLGRLGLGREANALTPTLHPSLEHVQQLAMGGDFGMAFSGGHWWVWGKNEEGQLGLGDVDRQNRVQPMKNSGLQSFDRVVVGDCHTLAFHVQTAEAGEKTSVSDAAGDIEDSEAAKRRRRAERFGIPLRR
mmetsp:Transcript_122453/g.236070  ORF Transcript_122453/g.236070 Transcript_122453/m.236070 type:complete len:647 (-) Transcript_122453:161-2101(-)